MESPPTLLPGRPAPLGARWDGQGVNIAVHAPDAHAVTLCLFDDPDASRPTRELALTERSATIWHGYLPRAAPGLAYGLRADGPWDPARGLRFNPHKLLLDPHALAVAGELSWDPAIFGHRADDPSARDERDSAPFVPRGLVIDPRFDWGDDRPPATPWQRSLIYECHVGRLTAAHPELPPELRGTYLGLCAEPVIEHLRSLGVSAVELLPVAARVSEHALVRRGLQNAWGYNTLGFFAPDARFASGDDGRQVAEFQQMVKVLHAAGIEVLLDVVYNHTCEADLNGPTLSWRGLDGRGYYQRVPDDPGRLVDVSGCGNSLDAAANPGLRMILDSLRHWVSVMHVDGFRFDLAAALARPSGGGPPDGRFFDVVAQDPLLSTVKLIAEPWDAAADGHLQGRLPPSWSEWNGRFRDRVRRFWRGDAGQRAALASRLSGSADLLPGATRRSINFVTCHDGFTLADLVSYETKHNEDNREDNRDGSDHEHSCHWGVEGPTDDPAILALRERARRNLVATLLLSCGVPMLLAGDELSHGQGGNNNSYCQSGELVRLDWRLDERREEFLAFVRHVAGVASEHPVLRRRRHFSGLPQPDLGGTKDLTWLRPDGAEMSQADWHDGEGRALGALLAGAAADWTDAQGRRQLGPDLVLLLNASAEPLTFRLPERASGTSGFTRLIDTEDPARHGQALPAPSAELPLAAHALLLLRLHEDDG